MDNDVTTARTKLKHMYNLCMQVRFRNKEISIKHIKINNSVVINTAKTNYIQRNIINSNNTPKVLWNLVNRKRDYRNNTFTCNICLQCKMKQSQDEKRCKQLLSTYSCPNCFKDSGKI